MKVYILGGRMEEEKNVQPISSYDTEALIKAFERLPNPDKSFSWKLIRLTDYLVDHKKWYIRWPGFVFAFLVYVPFFLIYNKIHYGSFISK